MRTASGFPNADSTRSFIARDLAADVVALFGSARRDRDPRRSGPDAGQRARGTGRCRRPGPYPSERRTDPARARGRRRPGRDQRLGQRVRDHRPRDWLALLEALEQPSHPARARAAALTPLIGWSATRLAGASESELEGLHQRLHVWARTLREQGISTLSESILSGGRAAGAAAGPGRRRTASDRPAARQRTVERGSRQRAVRLAALTAWLRQRIPAAAREGSNDERTRRLDSDADAVQVLTFHRSKGLEFPSSTARSCGIRAALPIRASPSTSTMSDGDRAIDVGLSGGEYDGHLRRHNIEERGEELRLAYVALTRARHQAVIWWASAWYAKNRRSDGCCSPRTPRATSIGGRPRPREDDAGSASSRSRGCPHAVSLEPAAAGIAGALERGDRRRRDTRPRALRAADRHRLAADLLHRAERPRTTRWSRRSPRRRRRHRRAGNPRRADRLGAAAVGDGERPSSAP